MALEIQNDPNILYGGDVDDIGPIDGGFGSLGAMLIADLKTGGERTAFVSEFRLIVKLFKFSVLR